MKREELINSPEYKLVHKLHRAYKKKDNWEYSRFKGYPEGTYFGYPSFDEMKKSVVKEYTEFYGKGLRKWRYY